MSLLKAAVFDIMPLLLEYLWHETLVALKTLLLVVFLPVNVSFWFLVWEEKTILFNMWHKISAVMQYAVFLCFFICSAPNCELLFRQEWGVLFWTCFLHSYIHTCLFARICCLLSIKNGALLSGSGPTAWLVTTVSHRIRAIDSVPNKDV